MTILSFFNYIVGRVSSIAPNRIDVGSLEDDYISTFVESAFMASNNFILLLSNVECFLGIMLLIIWFVSSLQKFKAHNMTNLMVNLCKLTILGVVTLLFINFQLYGDVNSSSNVFDISRFSFYSKICLALFTAPLIWIVQVKPQIRYYILSILLFSFLLVSATNLIGFYITLEALSLLSYGIIAYSRDISASEAAMKYYIYGVIASALLIYGLSVQYKLYGTLLYDEIHLESLINDPSTPQLIVFICVGSAFLYKLSLFPFHFALPDIYQAIPWYTILIINLTIKISIMLAFLRFWSVSFINAMTVEMESTVLIFIAIFSIIIGCFGALVQDSIKRFFAYTSINQAGFIILGLCCNTLIGTQASLFYLISYMVAMLIFLIVLIESNYKLETIQDILQENTLKKLILIISMFSMAGVPPLLGFVSKYLIWIALVSSISIENLYALNFYDLSLTCAFIISVITSLISSFYYLRFIKIFGFPTYKVIINSTTSEQLLTVANIKCISIGLAFLIIWPVFIQTYWDLLFEWSLSSRAHWVFF